MLGKWSLVSIPDHQGVMNVGGRLGAADGPRAFFRCFESLNGRYPIRSSLVARHDVSPITPDVQKNHALAAEAVQSLHAQTGLSVVVGGGHDHGYSHLVGIRNALDEAGSKPSRIGCLNLDAHFDVRKPEPVISSGSPFYLAIERKVLDPKLLVEFGIQEHSNSPELWEYVERNRVKMILMKDIRHGKACAAFKSSLKELSSKSDAVVISLDLDAIRAADAPGVSAPQSEGLTSSELIEMMEIAGANKKVISLGIFELNPCHDQDDRTARLAATAAYHFLSAKLQG